MDPIRRVFMTRDVAHIIHADEIIKVCPYLDDDERFIIKFVQGCNDYIVIKNPSDSLDMQYLGEIDEDKYYAAIYDPSIELHYNLAKNLNNCPT